jgi:hypothetical protein
VRLGLSVDDESAVHVAIEEAPAATPDLNQRILDTLAGTEGALSRESIRCRVGARNQTVGETLAVLLDEGHIEKVGTDYRIKNASTSRNQDQTRPADTDALLGSNVVTTGR